MAPARRRSSARRSARTCAAPSSSSPRATPSIVRHQGYRATYRQLWDQVTLAAQGLLARGVQTGDRVGIWSPNRYEWVVIQYATARIGAILVNVNPAYQTMRAGVRPAPVRHLAADPGARVPAVRLRRDGRRGAPELPGAARDPRPRRRLGGAARGRRIGRRGDAGRAGGDARSSTTRSTSSTPPARPASRRARPSRTTTILNNGYFIGERLKLTEHDRVCIPVPFYHCFGMVLGNLACTTHGACMVDPGGGVPARCRRWRRSRRSAAPRSTACRRCSSPSSNDPAFDHVRSLLAAHRHHGRLALPGRGDEAGDRRRCTCRRSRSATA